MRSKKQNYKAINNKLKEFEQKNTVFDSNQTPKCHPALNPEKAHLNFDCKLKNQKQKHLVTNFVEKTFSSENNCASLLANIILIPS